LSDFARPDVARRGIETASAVDAGVDWLEAGTPLLLAHGLRAVEALRARFPDHPIVADLKTMDAGYLETEMMAKAGASLVVVMGRAHEATIRKSVEAGRAFGVKVMGDNLAADRVAARWMEASADFIVHHIGFDERRRCGLSRWTSLTPSSPPCRCRCAWRPDDPGDRVLRTRPRRPRCAIVIFTTSAAERCTTSVEIAGRSGIDEGAERARRRVNSHFVPTPN
jgi:hypothetical protein